MKIVIAGGGTGGHLIPALTLAEALVALDSTVEPVMVGAQRGVEAFLLPRRSFRYHLLPLEPIYRKEWWKNLRWPVIAWKTLRACNRVLDSERPVLALGTGGYASGPLMFQALRRGLPVALLEQNAYPGVATRWLVRRARQIYLGFPEAAPHLTPGPTTKVHTFGNPVTPPAASPPDRGVARQHFGIDPDAFVVLVMGGSQGSLAINRTIAELVSRGDFDDTVLLWSTGQTTWGDYRQHEAPPKRQLRAFWDPMSDAYAVADLVIARAGAMTTAELCVWGLPAILIPLPTAAADHQACNADALAAAGAAIHLPESQLSADTLGSTVADLLRSRNRLTEMGRAALARGRPEAARRIVHELLTLVS